MVATAGRPLRVAAPGRRSISGRDAPGRAGLDRHRRDGEGIGLTPDGGGFRSRLAVPDIYVGPSVPWSLEAPMCGADGTGSTFSGLGRVHDRDVHPAWITLFFIQTHTSSLMDTPSSLAEKIERLPPELRDRLGAFVDELLTLIPEKEPSKKRPRLAWAGGLAESRDRYTSVELQHKALEWRQ